MNTTKTPTRRTMERRIRAAVDRATLEEHSAGLHWYDSARDLAGYLGAKYFVHAEVAAVVIAAHSRNARWDENVRRAEAQLAGKPYGLGVAIRESAAAMADPQNALSYITGPKLYPFACNIAGDLDEVTTDRWAQRVAFGMPATPEGDATCERLINRKGVRDAVKDAYRKVAADVGLPPAVVQAIAWVVIRGNAL